MGGLEPAICCVPSMQLGGRMSKSSIRGLMDKNRITRFASRFLQISPPCPLDERRAFKGSELIFARRRINISPLLRRTLDFRDGSDRDTKPCPQRRQLSSKAVAGCGRRLRRQPLSTALAIDGGTCPNCGRWGRRPWHLQWAKSRLLRCKTRGTP
jgi:hypothetical protein